MNRQLAEFGKRQHWPWPVIARNNKKYPWYLPCLDRTNHSFIASEKKSIEHALGNRVNSSATRIYKAM